jgi:hypothetical protein
MALKGKTLKAPMRFIAPKCKSWIKKFFFMKYYFVTTHSGKFSKVLWLLSYDSSLKTMFIKQQKYC